MQVVDKYGNTFGQGHLIITSKSGKSKLPVVTVAWGNITGALIDQTDLQDALNLKVPTARTITINGVTQDLTANRTWTISTGITVDTTPITGGVAGRVLFEGVGNVVQESPNFLWDNTNGRITVNAITNGAVAIFKNSTNGLTIYPQSTQVQVYSDYFGAGTDKPLIFGTYSNRTNQLSLFISGNIGVNTATDAGYKLDVAGSIRTQSSLVLLNPAFTLGGSITHSANATLVIAGGPGGGENITIGPSNRIFINAQQSRFPNGSVQIGSTLSVGSANTTAATMLWVTGGVGASSALARGIGLDSTLVAVANNDVLVGLDIAPTYTNGAFTGLTNIDLRTKGIGLVIGSGVGYGALYGYNNDGVLQVVDGGTSALSGYGYATQLWLRPSGNASGLNSNYWATIEQSTGGLFIQSGRYNSNIFIKTGRAGTSGNIYFNNAGGTMAMFFGATANLGIGTTTDAGYKLDVNGTSRTLGTHRIWRDNAVAEIKLELYGGQSGWESSIYHNIGAGGADQRLTFRVAGSTSAADRMSILTNGNVGIGTTTPFGKFDVKDGEIFVTTSTNANLRSRLTYQGLYVSRASDGGYPENIVSINSAWEYNSRNAHTFYRDTIPLLSIGALQSTAGININTNGNVLINTNTDAGFKLDVNGTAVVRGITNVIGGTLRIASTGTLTQPSYITSHSDGGWNFTTYTHERGAGVHYFTSNNGSASIFSASAREGVNINVSSLTTGNPFSISGTVNASSAIARGQLINTTLVAAANNDVLVGLDVQPTFTNGAFTGVSNYVARLGGHIGISTANAFGLNYISFSALTANQGISATYGPNGTPAGYAYNFQFAKSSTSNSNGLLFIGGGASAGGNSANKHIISTSADGTALGQQLVLRTAITGQSWSLVNDHFTIFPGGNVVIQSTSQSATDAGYKLDVNGTARVQGVITGSVSAGSLILGAASANQVGIALNGYFVNSGAISTSNFNARSFNHTIGGQGAGIVSTFNGIAQGITTNCEYFVARGNINLTDGAIDLSGFNFSPTIVSEIGATIRAFSSSLSAGANRWNLFLSGTAKNYIAGNLLIGTTTDVASSKLTVESTTQGFLPPRMSNAQMLAIATPAEGLMVYDTTNRKLCCYDGTTWQNLF